MEKDPEYLYLLGCESPFNLVDFNYFDEKKYLNMDVD